MERKNEIMFINYQDVTSEYINDTQIENNMNHKKVLP